jgi:hypothetical protein
MAAAAHRQAANAAIRRRRVRNAARASCERRIAAAMFGGRPTRFIAQHGLIKMVIGNTADHADQN